MGSMRLPPWWNAIGCIGGAALARMPHRCCCLRPAHACPACMPDLILTGKHWNNGILPTHGLKCGFASPGLGGFYPVPGTNQFVPQPNPCARTRFHEAVTGTLQPGGFQCGAGRRATGGREVGRGVRRAAGQVSRDRLNLGRTVVALAGCGPGPVSVAVARWRARRRRASSSLRCVRRVRACCRAHRRTLGGPPRRRGGWQ